MRSKGWRLALLLSVPLPLAGEARDPFRRRKIAVRWRR